MYLATISSTCITVLLIVTCAFFPTIILLLLDSRWIGSISKIAMGFICFNMDVSVYFSFIITNDNVVVTIGKVDTS